jgi:hypothetical protein
LTVAKSHSGANSQTLGFHPAPFASTAIHGGATALGKRHSPTAVAELLSPDNTAYSLTIFPAEGTDPNLVYQVQLQFSALCGLAGDVVPNGVVDSEDLQTTAARWHQRSTDAGWDAAFDLNTNGLVDIADLMRVVAQLGTTCP